MVITGALMAFGLLAVSTTSCHIDEVQQLFAQRTTNALRIEALLSDCVSANSTDYRVPLLRGVLARDRGDLRAAAALLLASHDLAPTEATPMLELAITDEWLGALAAADQLYAQVLTLDPASRPAILGRARVARARYRLTDAAAYYQRLLNVNANDVDALAGMAWVMLAENRFDESRALFGRVLVLAPGNTDATTGLADVAQGWRDRYDLGSGYTNAPSGIAWSGIAAASFKTSAFDTLELGAVHNSNEISTPDFLYQRTLATDDFHVGYIHQVPAQYSWSVGYDERLYHSLSDQHWLQVGGSAYVTPRVQTFATYRQSFGAPEWNDYLATAGVIVPISRTWDVQTTGYIGTYRPEISPGTFAPLRSADAVGLDLQNQVPGRAFFTAGVSYSDSGVVNFDLHARAIIPISPGAAIAASWEHGTGVHLSQALLGVQFFEQ